MQKSNEMSLFHPNYLIITGVMGAGKTTLLETLREHGLRCVEEPARAILAAQRLIGGQGTYQTDRRLFVELMLSQSIQQYQAATAYIEPVIFDRGIPDNLLYVQEAQFDVQHIHRAAELYRYHPEVLFLPAWEAIYTQDSERTLSFAQAVEYSRELKLIYQRLGYRIIEVPRDTPAARADFVMDYLRVKQLTDTVRQTALLQELQAREPIFHHPARFGTSLAAIQKQMDAQFWEVGASGNVYTQQEIIDTLLARYQDPHYRDDWQADDFKLTQLDRETCLLTYRLIQDQSRHTRRMTLWRQVAGEWKIIYHQGTLQNT